MVSTSIVSLKFTCISLSASRASSFASTTSTLHLEKLPATRTVAEEEDSGIACAGSRGALLPELSEKITCPSPGVQRSGTIPDRRWRGGRTSQRTREGCHLLPRGRYDLRKASKAAPSPSAGVQSEQNSTSVTGLAMTSHEPASLSKYTQFPQRAPGAGG